MSTGLEASRTDAGGETGVACQRRSIVCVSGALEKLQMAAMFASVGAATGDEIRVFFSMNALVFFLKGNTDEAQPEGEFGALLGHTGVPPFRQLFQQAVEIGDARLLPCSMAMDLLGVTEADLVPEFGPPTGLTKFIGDAEGGQLLSF